MADQDQTQGRTLSRYRLLEEVGQGGMAVVYKGFDTTLNREVAVKVLHPHLAGMAESRARLQREAHAVAKLRHENILEIFDYSGPDSPESYIVTEFIHGKTLKTFLADHPLPYPEVAEMIASEVARALEHAHALGVIHRDIKPENVMIRDDGLVKLMDFGIAQIVDKERMTVTGQLLGSPAYMAPEHVEGKPLDFRTDVFAVGILLYQLSTGQLPFRGKNPHEVLKRIAECKFAPPEMANPKIGARLGRVIGRALEREPDRRYPDVTPLRVELLEDLADAGIDDPRKELQQFFADPEGWARAFKPRLVESLARRGKALEQKGRTAAALELWSRALAVDPKSAELQAMVAGIARRRQVGRIAVFTAAGLLAVGGSAFGLRAWQKHATSAVAPGVPAGPKPTEPVRTGPAQRPGPTEKPVVAPPAPKLEADPPRKLHASAHKIAPALAAAPTRVIEIVPIPAAVRVFIDGKDLGMYENNTYPVSEGRHAIRLENALCFPYEGSVEPNQAKVIARLNWRPATVTLHTTPAGADVVVEGRVASDGQGVPVKIDPLSEDGRKDAVVKVSAAGYRTKELKVPVRANEKVERTVALEKLGSPE